MSKVQSSRVFGTDVIVPFLDLRVTDEVELNALLEAYRAVLEHGRLVMGPEIEELEAAVAASCARRFSVAVGSGTDALFLGLRALGVGPGDEVITSSLSWIATANAIKMTGATPVFADIGDDLNINTSSAEALIGERTAAILTVNYTGRIADNIVLERLANARGLLLMEDASQSFGATFKGRPSGSFGDLSAMSHNPMKVLAATGEAGSITLDDARVDDRVRQLRYAGTVNKETCLTPSLNGRMDTVQAAALLVRLSSNVKVFETRRANAAYYDEALSGLVAVPARDDDHVDVFYTYTIRSSRRDELKEHLVKFGIETKVQHPLLMPQQPAYEGSKGEWSHAASLVKQVLCIPIHEKLTFSQREKVAEAVISFGPSLPEYS